MRSIQLWVVLLLCLITGACAAAEAGTGEGYYIDDAGQRIELSHVVAVLIDGAETDEPPSVRVAITDRPVPASAIERFSMPELIYMGDRGEVRGILLRFALEDPEYVFIDSLIAAEEGADRLVDQAVMAEQTLRIARADERGVAAEFAVDSWIQAQVRFDTPYSHDPVVQRLVGEEAHDSELARLTCQRMEAQMSGDPQAYAALATADASRRQGLYQERGANFIAEAMRANAPMIRDICRKPDVVVTRSRTAAAVYGRDVYNFERVSGAWKVAN